MVYESDFYTTRRPYRASPSVSSYTVSTPRHYVVRDSPGQRTAEQVYSYSYNSTVDSSNSRRDPYFPPSSRSYSSSESVSRSSAGGPGGYSYSSERSSRTRGDGPGGYSSSYSSTTSGRLPGGTTYRHYSYRETPQPSPGVPSTNIGIPTRQVKIFPGMGKVHVTYSCDHATPYVGHKRLTVTSSPARFGTRPAVLRREFERIERRVRPWSGFSATNRYLDSDSAVTSYRTYCLSYPITSGYSTYHSVNIPSTTSLAPKFYRWHYSWPREYLSYWPYFRSYLTRYLNSLSFGNYLLPSTTSTYYWSSYLPYYRSLDCNISELENKIDGLRVRNDLYWSDTTVA